MQNDKQHARRRDRSPLVRYTVAVAAVIIATLIRRLLDPWLGDLFPFAVLFFAVLAVAWYGGFGPAIAASFLGAIASAAFLLPPRGTLAVVGIENQLGLALYVLVSIGMALLGGAMQSARLRAERLARVAVDQREQLRESEERYREIVENTHEGIWQLDANGHTRFANSRMAEMLHCSAEELRSSSVADFLDVEGRKEILAFRERRKQGISEQIEMRFWRKDGTELCTLISASPTYDADGKFDGVLGMLSDISEWKQADRKVRESEERLRLALDALRNSDQRKDEFLAVLGHELRNPLAPISNALQVLKLRGTDAAITERARAMMERQLEHLVRLVDDLLDVSRIMSGKVELRRERVELTTVIARAVETAQPAVDADGHELTLALSPEALWVNGDLVRLSQVMANLLNNAAKYTDKGGQITLSAAAEGEHAVLRVRDNGIGIKPELLPRIFDMFFQAERRTTDAQGGLGIGLSLVSALVELHGGAVEAHSDGLGSGSEFVVRLPLLAHEQADDSGLKPDAQSAGTPFPASRVLVVDDNIDAADSLGMLLRMQGQDVTVLYDAPSALAHAEANPPSVAFLDLGMPKMDGYELARRFRESPKLQNALLIAVTGWGQPEDRQRTHKAGFNLHVVKPVELDALRKVLSEHACARE
jgi:PAS domain S-box-containing protein